MLALGHTATYRSSLTANMHLIGERDFLYRYRIVIVCMSVTGHLIDVSESENHENRFGHVLWVTQL